MKLLTLSLSLSFISLLTACGNMSNNTNEDHTHYTDSSGMNADDANNPNASDAPMRNVYDTDSTTNTSGPDNAAPKASSGDTIQSSR